MVVTYTLAMYIPHESMTESIRDATFKQAYFCAYFCDWLLLNMADTNEVLLQCRFK